MSLTTNEINKVQDLNRIYGISEVAEYLKVSTNIVKIAIVDGCVDDSAAKKIRSGMRQYWKNWMSEWRNLK